MPVLLKMRFYIQADQDWSVLWISVMQIKAVFGIWYSVNTQLMVWKLGFASFNAKLQCQERLSAFYFSLQGGKKKSLTSWYKYILKGLDIIKDLVTCSFNLLRSSDLRGNCSQ